MSKALKEFQSMLSRKTCPTCKQSYEEEKHTQGGTVFASPCGHVLYFYQAARLCLESQPSEQSDAEEQERGE